jgi:hypothetical protein
MAESHFVTIAVFVVAQCLLPMPLPRSVCGIHLIVFAFSIWRQGLQQTVLPMLPDSSV